MSDEKKLVRFDWAMKYLLRDKANYDIVEGFLCALLEDNNLQVIEILESETNKDDENDKFNRVDVIVKDNQARKILIEIQNSRETDYLYRILYSASKHIAESINAGDAYKNIVKIISVNILYFDLGIGDDYLYYGTTEFVGMNTAERVTKNTERIKKIIPSDAKYNMLEIYPEYYLIQVERYPNVVSKAIDEWIYWFKNEKVKEGSKSKNITKVEAKLNILKMTKQEREAYEHFLEKLASERDIIATAHEDGKRAARKELQQVLNKERQEKEKAQKEAEEERKEKEKIQKQLLETAKMLKDLGVGIDDIILKTGLSREEIEKL